MIRKERMDQKEIGKLIKDFRKKNNLTQAQFAQKYGVTYQAVSKWGNGKNIPDILILKQICQDFNINIDDLLEGNNKKKKNIKKIIISIGVLILVLLLILIITLLNNTDSNFTFKTISTSCSNFEIFGSAAYNRSKSYIYIANINYCGETDNTDYQTIECHLYENNNDLKVELSKYTYSNDSPIKLDDFLQTVEFNLDNFTLNCNEMTDYSLLLEINCTDTNKKITTYRIPLILDDSCNRYLN